MRDMRQVCKFWKGESISSEPLGHKGPSFPKEIWFAIRNKLEIRKHSLSPSESCQL